MTQQIKVYTVDAFIKDDAGGSPTGVVLNANSYSTIVPLRNKHSHYTFFSQKGNP